MATTMQNKFKTVIFCEESRAVSMRVHVHTYKTCILEHCGFEITTAVRLHLLLWVHLVLIWLCGLFELPARQVPPESLKTWQCSELTIAVFKLGWSRWG